jgi:hypothetical protein
MPVLVSIIEVLVGILYRRHVRSCCLACSLMAFDPQETAPLQHCKIHKGHNTRHENCRVIAGFIKNVTKLQ